MKKFINFILVAFVALSGVTHAQNVTVSQNVHSILQAPNYAAIRGLLDLEPGVDFLSITASAAAYQPKSSNLTLWAATTPSQYQPLSSNLTYWSAVAPSSYLTTAAASSTYQPLDSDLTAWAAVNPSAYTNTAGLVAGYQPKDADLTAIAALADPNADRLLGWDDSAGTWAWFTASGGGFDEAGDYTLTGTWDYTSATLTLGDLSVTTLDAASLEIGGVAVTSTAAELNVLDGVPAGLTATEIGYSDGVTSSIQTQLNAKAGSSAAVGTFGITIDGGGSALTTGIKGDVSIPYACTINSVTMLADQSGSVVVDVWKDTYANYPPTDADSITASAVPTISAAVKSTNSTLTGWTTSVAAGDTIRFNVDSASTITRLTLVIKVTKS